MSDSEWLEIESNKSRDQDWIVIFLRWNSLLIRFYGLTKWRWWARFVVSLESAQYARANTKLGEGYYNDILADYINIVLELLGSELNVGCMPLSIDDFGDTNGFDIFNATSFPAFGINYISVNSGIFFHTHTLVRTLQPFLMETKLPRFMERILIKNFVKSAIGLVSYDHTRSFQNIRLIPIDDGLLEGAELFIVAHEVYHLAYKNDPSIVKVFSYYSSQMACLCNGNEEIGADGFGVLILYYYQQKTKSQFMLYSPCFLFKVLSFCDETIGREHKPTDPHPTNASRHDYVAQMLYDLNVGVDIDSMDATLMNVMSPCKTRIREKATKILTDRKALIDLYREMLSVAKV